MNILKIAMLAFAIVGCWACNDDDGDIKTTGGAVPEASKVAVSFQDAGKTVLKNSGVVNIPVVLAEAAPEQVKVAISVKEASGDTIAKEVVDFTISSKVLVVEKGSKVANVEVVLNNDGKTDAKAKMFELQIAGVYGAGKKAEEKQTCQVAVVSNAFVEFEKNAWSTYEAAATEGAETADTRFVPLTITGKITEACKIIIEVIDSTAKEYEHYTLASKEITVNPGDARVMAEVLPIDDNLPNADRKFFLRIKEIVGGNLVIGKNKQISAVSIISEEVRKVLSMGETTFTVPYFEKELLIPINVDKELTKDITVEIEAKGSSTAAAGSDYQITQSTATILAGNKSAVVKIKILASGAAEDRIIKLGFKSADDAYAQFSDTASECTVNLIHNYFPSFAAQNEVEEGYGDFALRGSLYPMKRARVMKVTFSKQNDPDNIYFKDYSTVITIPADSTVAKISMNVGANEELMPAAIPELTMSVTEVDGYELPQPIVLKLKVVECAYRKLLGNWTMNAFNPDNCNGTSDAVISKVTWLQEVKVVMKNLWNNQNLYFNMTFDKKTRKLKMILNKQCEDHSWNFGGANTSVVLRFLVDGQTNLTDIEMDSYNVENGVITFPKDKHIGGGGSNGSLTGTPTVWGFFFQNGNLTKK